MPRNLSVAALAAFALLLASGCSTKWNSPAIPQIAVNDIVPLAVGNQWTYVDSTFAAGTGALQTVDSSRVMITGHGTIRVSGTACDVYDWTWVDPVTGVPDPVSFVVGTAPNGTYSYGGRSSAGLYSTGRFLELRYPVYLNDSWLQHEVVYWSARGFVDTTFAYQCTAPSLQFHLSPTDSLRSVEYYFNYFFFYSNDPNHSHHAETFLYYCPGVGYVGLVEKLDGVIVGSKRLRHFQLLPASAATASLPLPPARTAVGIREFSLWRSAP
jgi:hypothetical protein